MNDYANKMTEALMNAMMSVALEAGAGQTQNGRSSAFVDSQVVTDCCIAMIALVVHTCEDTKTASKNRAFCDGIARRLNKSISAMQRSGFAESAGITTINVDGVQ